MNLPGLICLAGPTGVGKSEIAEHLALLINGEIVSVDSMQVYRGLDIGTAKATMRERGRVPHHLIDIVDVTGAFSAAEWVGKAHEAVRDIRSRSRNAILVGGTGLYFKGFLEGLGNAPPSDPELRRTIEQTPIRELLLELQRKDPVTFRRIDRTNPRRVFRAVEVVRLSGRPFSELRAQWRKDDWKDERGEHPVPAVFIGVERARADLRRRIDKRVERMFELGLVEEVKSLLARGLEQNRTAMQAIGYRQVIEFLEGTRRLDETKTLVKQRTWQFAKRQMTWFRNQAPVNWILAKPDESLAALAERLALQVRPGR